MLDIDPKCETMRLDHGASPFRRQVHVAPGEKPLPHACQGSRSPTDFLRLHWRITPELLEERRERGTAGHDATLTDRAVGWLERNHQEPFFLYFAHTAVHRPVAPNPEFKGKPLRHLRRLHRGARRVGRPAARRPRPAEVADNTLVIFTSDNGGVIARHRRTRRRPEGGPEDQRPAARRQARHLGGRIPRAVPGPLAGQGAGRDGERPGGLPDRRPGHRSPASWAWS